MTILSIGKKQEMQHLTLSENEDRVIADLGIAQKFKFMVHRNKGGWDAKPIEQLVSEMKREVEELEDALKNGASKESCITEAADVANYSAMIVDKLKRG